MNDWKKHHIKVDKARGIGEHFIDGVLRGIAINSIDSINRPLTFREMSLTDDHVSTQIAHTKRIGFYKKEIGFRDDKIAKLKKQIIQLQERCDKAEKPSAYVLVERTWNELQDNDFIAYFFDYSATGDPEEDCHNKYIDCRVWRAEKRELTNENGVRTDDMEKLEAVLEKSEEE